MTNLGKLHFTKFALLIGVSANILVTGYFRYTDLDHLNIAGAVRFTRGMIN